MLKPGFEDISRFLNIFARFGLQVRDYELSRASSILTWRDGSIRATRDPWRTLQWRFQQLVIFHFSIFSITRIFFVRIDIICHLRPSHHYENDRNWIILLRSFHQNHHFRCIFTMMQATFQGNPLFHFEASEVTLEGILSFMLGLLQARQVVIFQRSKTWPK